mgnify:FL=1
MATTTNTNGRATTIEVPTLEIGRCQIEVVGTADLLVHRFSEKGRRMIADKQAGKATKKREKRDPVADYFGAMYIVSGDPSTDQNDVTEPVASADCLAVHGMPAAAFRKAMVRGAKMAGAVMTDTKTAFMVETVGADNLVPLTFAGVSMDESVVRLQGKTSDLRYRPRYSGWGATLSISYNASLIGMSQLVNLLRNAGFGVGVGEWRPERDGSFGMFTVGAVEDLGVEGI